MENKRITTRADFKTQINIISIEGEFIGSGKMLDVSVFGMRLKSDCDVELNTKYQYKITINAANSKLSIEDIVGEVKNITNGEIGIEFDKKFDWFALFRVYSFYGKER